MNSKRRILLVSASPADVDVWQGLSAGLGKHWECAYASVAEEALGMLALGPYDVVIAAVGPHPSETIEFLNRVWKTYPKIVRFAATDPEDHEVIARCVLGSHQILRAPVTLENLKAVLDRMWLVSRLIHTRHIRELVSKVRAFPSIPSIYFEVMKELGSPIATHDSIGAMIAKDMAMTTKLIQMVNSAYFGLNRQITDPGEAVLLLGTETIRSLVLGIQAFAQADKIKPIYFSIHRIWSHSMAVAESAKLITLRETGDAQLADLSYTAGLLHDIGKLVLATNFDEQYGNAMALAKKRDICPAVIERELFGATHAEVGAYMISLWGLPTAIVEAAALHHTPSRSHAKTFSPLTAIHAANVIEHERNPHQDGFADPAFDLAYLEHLQLSEHIDEWRQCVEGSKSNSKHSAPEDPNSDASEKNALPAVPELAASAPPTSWVAVAAAVIVLVVWIGALLWWVSEPTPVRTVAARKALKPARLETNATAAPDSSLSERESSRQEPSQEPETNGSNSAAAPQSSPVIFGFDAIKVQGILSSRRNPTVVINGQSLRVGESILRVQVVNISSNAVVLECDGARKTVLVP